MRAGDDDRAQITIPWIAFVPDISGVWSSVGTFEITCTPRKAARIRTVSSIRKLVFIPALPPSG